MADAEASFVEKADPGRPDRIRQDQSASNVQMAAESLDRSVLGRRRSTAEENNLIVPLGQWPIVDGDVRCNHDPIDSGGVESCWCIL